MKYRKFIVIARDFYREHPPIRYEIMACDREDAMSRVSVKDHIKEVLDVSTQVIWNKETVIKYWKIYSETVDESRITEEYLNYTPLR